MNFALLWIDALLVSLLWVAALVACAGRVRRWLRVIILMPVVGFPLLVFGLFVFVAFQMRFVAKFEPNWFDYSVSLLIAYAIFSLLIARQGARRTVGMPPAAATWRRMPIIVAGLLALAVGYMALIDMDLAIRAKCAIQSIEINSLYLATLPAIRSESENAAPLYEKAFAHLKDAPPTDINNPPFGDAEKFDPAEPATVSYLKRQATTIDLLRQAAALPGCRFDVDLENPDMQTLISSLSQLRTAANLLLLHAKYEIAQGRGSSAIRDATAIMRMSRHFGQRPMLISALAAMGTNAQGVRALYEALPLVKDSTDLSSLHLDELASFHRIYQQALRGEERFGLNVYSNLNISSPGYFDGVETVPSRTDGIRGAFFRVFVFGSDTYLDLMADVQRLAMKPFYESHDEVAALQGKYGNNMFASILTPAFGKAFTNLGIAEADDGCAKVGVAMARYRLDNGKLPGRLADLTPRYLDEVPIDPFDGKPLRLVTKGDERIVYSIGPDLTDNGGAEYSGPDGKGDISFKLK